MIRRVLSTTLNRVGLSLAVVGAITEAYVTVRYGWPVLIPGGVFVLGVVLMEVFHAD